MCSIGLKCLMKSVAMSLLVVAFVSVVESGVVGSRTTVSPHRKQQYTLPSGKDLSQQDALKFLEEYGYLDGKNAEKDSEARKQRVGKGGKRPRPASPSDKDKDSSEQPDLKEGITAFQRRFHLQVTGEIDDATKAIMSRPRCGVPDVNKKQEPTASSASGGAAKKADRASPDATETMVTDVVTEVPSSAASSDGKGRGKSLASLLLHGNPKGSKDGKLPIDSPSAPAMTPEKPSSIESVHEQFSDASFYAEEDSELPRYSDLDDQDGDIPSTTMRPFEDYQDTTMVTYSVTELLSTELIDDIDASTELPPVELDTAINHTDGAQDTASRRRRDLREIIQRVASGALSPSSPESHHRRRRNTFTGDSESSPSGAGWRLSDINLPITWRIVNEYSPTSINNPSDIFYTAFRRWAEVTPLTFSEQSSGDVRNVDIAIKFVQSRDLPAAGGFHWSDGQLAYSDLTSGEILFNDDEIWTDRSNKEYNLLTVAAHEIGHFLGLGHSTASGSTMYPFYQSYEGEVTIDSESRTEVQALYGKCNSSFDTVFDWVRMNTGDVKVYSTYFTRTRWAWLYSNTNDAVRYAYPRLLRTKFSGVPDDLDAVAQDTQQLDMYFFKGDRYWKYDHNNRRVYTTSDGNVDWTADGRLISEGWPAKSGSNIRIPDNVDAAYYDVRDGNFYFFKNDLVYAYDKDADGCCLNGYPKQISDAYPGQYQYIPALPNNIDAVYYSVAKKKLYFFKGALVWENATFNPRHNSVTNKVSSSVAWNTVWQDVCNVE